MATIKLSRWSACLRKSASRATSSSVWMLGAASRCCCRRCCQRAKDQPAAPPTAAPTAAAATSRAAGWGGGAPRATGLIGAS